VCARVCGHARPSFSLPSSSMCAFGSRHSIRSRPLPPPLSPPQLVLDLLQACQLDYSLSVVKTEASLDGAQADREGVADELGLKATGSSEPLLVQLVRAAMDPGGVAASTAGAATHPAAAAASASVVGAGLPAAAAPVSAADVTPASGLSAAPLAAQPVAGKEGGGKPTPSNDASSSPFRAAVPPVSPPSPASPLLSVLPPLGKPKGPPSTFLSDLPPLSGRGATVPPLGNPAPTSMCSGAVGSSAASGAGGHDIDEKRLDALENKLSTLAGLPLRPAASGASSQQLAPLGSPRAQHPLSGAGVAMETADHIEEVIEDDIMEEDFEDDDDEGDASLSLSAGEHAMSSSGGGAPPPPYGGLSPAALSPGGHVIPPPRSRQRLSPLETSIASLDEPMSPARYSREMASFDLAESIEMPGKQ
jgi:hypothetical protein